MKKLVVDLDGTLTVDDPGRAYPDKEPKPEIVQKLREYRDAGFLIVIHTARNMRTYAGNVGEINVHTLPVVLEWLREHDVPFDEVIVGKPWCGNDGFYVDDRAVRPSEFARMSREEINGLLRAEHGVEGGGTQ